MLLGFQTMPLWQKLLTNWDVRHTVEMGNLVTDAQGRRNVAFHSSPSWAKSTAHTTSPTQHVRPTGFSPLLVRPPGTVFRTLSAIQTPLKAAFRCLLKTFLFARYPCTEQTRYFHWQCAIRISALTMTVTTQNCSTAFHWDGKSACAKSGKN